MFVLAVYEAHESLDAVVVNVMGLILRCSLDMDCCTPLKEDQMIPLYLLETEFRSLPW